MTAHSDDRLEDHDLGAAVPRSDGSALSTGIRILRVSSWIFLLVGIVGSLDLDLPLTVSAAVAGAIFAASTSLVRLEAISPEGIALQSLLLLGAVVTMTSVALTGGAASAFVVLSMMPGLLASMVGGYRIGLTTALLSAGLLVGITLAAGGTDALLSVAGTVGLFPLLALLVAQIRALMLEAIGRASTLEIDKAEAEAELSRLGQANRLLRGLIDLYASADTNPVSVGRSAIQAIVDSQPGSFATATLFDSQGPVVVARAGTDSPGLIRTQFHLGYGDTTSGVVSIGTLQELTPEAREETERVLRPVGVAFSNAVLLQGIAREAVKEERLRLARELHDEVGPALAALGLSLDSVLMSVDEAPVTSELRGTRDALTVIVEDLRRIIADLRYEDVGSLTSALMMSTSGLSTPPVVELDISERRHPRNAAGRQIISIVTEAVRNAHRHANATMIRVAGRVDRDEVALEVTDDGTGFDPTRVPDGHYGVLGMRERADRIGATLEIASNDSGTTLTVRWKEGR